MNPRESSSRGFRVADRLQRSLGVVKANTKLFFDIIARPYYNMTQDVKRGGIWLQNPGVPTTRPLIWKQLLSCCKSSTTRCIEVNSRQATPPTPGVTRASSGPLRSKLAALKQYGLIEGNRRGEARRKPLYLSARIDPGTTRLKQPVNIRLNLKKQLLNLRFSRRHTTHYLLPLTERYDTT